MTIKKGFTLSEVLITLAIIGVISAISVPTLLQKTNQAELITAWKKNYSSISQAMAKSAFDEGNLPSSITSLQFRNKFENQMRIIKKCDNASQEGACWHSDNEWESLSGVKRSLPMNGNTVFESAILSNGSLILFNKSASFTCISTPDYSNEGTGCLEIVIDINGFKKPNVIGKDIFATVIFSDGTVNARNSTDASYTCTSTSTGAQPIFNGWNCSSTYLYSK